jgi:uncharacterized membrane protein YjgN (DUF898 family)
MTAVDMAPVAPPADMNEGRGRFLGSKRDYWRVLARDTLALIVTIGLYRFWVSTNIRRYLWSRTEIAGEQLDYTGDPIELLIGFLVLVVVLAPAVLVFSLLSWGSDFFSAFFIAPYLPIVLLFPLAFLALYQARRYRLNHTVFRGLRFRQTGSAIVYVLRGAAWSLLVLLTLGLAYPWARVSLERYKMRHTWFGEVQGSFVGSAWQLFKRGLLWWAIVWVPVILLSSLAGEDEESAGVAAVLAFMWLGLSSIIVYPFLHALVIRWRIAGIRFGTLSFEANFSLGRFAKSYFKFFGWLLLLAIVVGILAVIVMLWIVPAIPLGRSMTAEVIGIISLIIVYFIIATLMAFAYQATVRFETWRLIVETLVIRGVGQLDSAKAPAEPAARRRGRVAAAINLGGL